MVNNHFDHTLWTQKKKDKINPSKQIKETINIKENNKITDRMLKQENQWYYKSIIKLLNR